MCVTVIYKGKRLSRLGHLRDQFGDAVVIDDGYYDDLPDDTCLCPVDLQATARWHGLKVEQNDPDSMCYDFVPAS